MQITTIGLDIAKNVFWVHGIDAAEKVVVAAGRAGDRISERPEGFAGGTRKPLRHDSFSPMAPSLPR